MQAHYPHQEFADETVTGYLFDLERLAVVHGIEVLKVALLNIRIRPGQAFFPHPSEVADEIERMRGAKRADRAARETRKLLDEDERRFQTWVGEQLEANPHMTEQQLLDTIKTPGYTGRKARQR